MAVLEVTPYSLNISASLTTVISVLIKTDFIHFPAIVLFVSFHFISFQCNSFAIQSRSDVSLYFDSFNVFVFSYNDLPQVQFIFFSNFMSSV